MKYYFVKYRWKRYNTDMDWEHSNELINMNPVEWLANLTYKLDRGIINTQYVVDFYEEVDEDTYSFYLDRI